MSDIIVPDEIKRTEINNRYCAIIAGLEDDIEHQMETLALCSDRASVMQSFALNIVLKKLHRLYYDMDIC